MIYIEADRHAAGLDSESWWDVPVAEVSDEPDVRAARETLRAGAARAAKLPGDDR